MNSSQQPHIEAEDQIDIIALISKVWAGRRFVIKSAVIASVIGVLVAISTPNTYTASSMFTPNSSGGSSGGSSGLKGLASWQGSILVLVWRALKRFLRCCTEKSWRATPLKKNC